MSDAPKPSFKRVVAKKALMPVVTTLATAIATYLMRKAAELWEQQLQPKVEEKGGAEAMAHDAVDAVSRKVAPVTDAVASKSSETSSGSGSEDEERERNQREREQRRAKRRKALEQAGSS